MKTSKLQNLSNYLIYSNGKIYSYYTNKFIRPSKDKKGYLRICLYDDNGVKKTHKVHRLVAEAFLNNFHETLSVNHINYNRADNRIENLEMCTHEENMKHKNFRYKSK